jgi:hypothetical protein
MDRGIPLCCSSSCLTCETTYSKCTSCDPSRNLSNNTCGCKIGFYLDAGGTCQSCKYSCKYCNANNCTSCPSSRRFVTGSCLCNDGYYDDGSSTECIRNIPYLTLACHKSCLTCNGPNPNQCTTCLASANRLLSGTTCICKNKYFDIGKDVCVCN